jgi:hypothetical protein
MYASVCLKISEGPSFGQGLGIILPRPESAMVTD